MELPKIQKTLVSLSEHPMESLLLAVVGRLAEIEEALAQKSAKTTNTEETPKNPLT